MRTNVQSRDDRLPDADEFNAMTDAERTYAIEVSHIFRMSLDAPFSHYFSLFCRRRAIRCRTTGYMRSTGIWSLLFCRNFGVKRNARVTIPYRRSKRRWPLSDAAPHFEWHYPAPWWQYFWCSLFWPPVPPLLRFLVFTSVTSGTVACWRSFCEEFETNPQCRQGRNCRCPTGTAAVVGVHPPSLRKPHDESYDALELDFKYCHLLPVTSLQVLIHD